VEVVSLSVVEKAKQWYTRTICSMNESWDKLVDKFCLRFFSTTQMSALQKAIVSFQQNEKESLGVA
jgi:hypothetical protein